MKAGARTRSGGPLARLFRLDTRRTAKSLVRSFAEHDLLTYASAISFQSFFALIPLTLTALGLLGLFSLESVWSDQLARDLRPQVSGPVFEVINSTVQKVLQSKQIFWGTFGALLTIWEVSGAMRAVMTVLDRIYRVPSQRPWKQRYALSIGLSALTIVLLLAAGFVFVAGNLVDGVLTGILRWPVAGVLLLLALAAVVRWAPAERRPWRWVSFGTGLVVVAWLGMSAGFGLYLRTLADYGSIFGNLATLIVTLEYLYMTAIVFLAGLALDAITEERKRG
jgi:membrane protein